MSARRCAALALALGGCGGGGAPLLHGAHVLAPDSVTFSAGTSGHFALGDAGDAEDDLERTAASRGAATTDDERLRFTRGALTRMALAPGVAPFLAGRVGLGGGNEAGMAYTARTLRIDVRHAFEWPSLALSVGGVAIGALPRVSDRPTTDVSSAGEDRGLRSIALDSARGYGLELPILFGYRSSADVVKLWTGLRAGFERDQYALTLVLAPDDAFRSSAHATRIWGGGLVGFSVGLAPIEVRVELDAAYERVHGALVTGRSELSADVSGWSLTPAMAISAKF